MVDEDCHISGIIDWETAGWYPNYGGYANIIRPVGAHGLAGVDGSYYATEMGSQSHKGSKKSLFWQFQQL